MSLGDVFLRFDSREEMDKVLSKVDEWLTIELEKQESNYNERIWWIF